MKLVDLHKILLVDLVVTLPSEKDFRHPEAGPLLKKYLAGRKGVDVENRMRILRLIENMTLGRNAVGYLTESMHGAGSPQAQRIQIQRQMQVGYKKNLAKTWLELQTMLKNQKNHLITLIGFLKLKILFFRNFFKF